MKKKIVLGIAAAGSAIALLPLFAAFEAHVINVTATIENALSVDTDPLDFGTVFPEELLHLPLSLELSESFRREDRVDDVEYVIRQKPKCGLPVTPATDPVSYSAFGRVVHNPATGVYTCEDEGYVQLPLLCPFLSKHDDKTPDNDGSIDSFHGPLTGWTASTTEQFEVPGMLSKLAQDFEDIWDIDLHVPCFKGSCAQDNVVPDAYQLDPKLEHDLFGCDLWVEVTEVSETPQTPPPPPPPEPGTIIVTKIATTTDGTLPSFGIGDFSLFVGTEGVVSGVGESFAAGVFAISETTLIATTTFTATFGGDADCTDGSVTLDPGETISCILTNTEIDTTP